jgi:putative ABC transport system substrate-binding protein
LLQSAPDVILANGTPAAKTMQQASRTVPVIFIAGSDPVLDGLVPSLAHPGGNLTGFYVFEPSLGANCSDCSRKSRRMSPGRLCCSTRTPTRPID